MDIKKIHLIFIIASIILSVFFAVWSWGYSQEAGHGGYKAASIASGLIGLVLIIYAFYFVKKARSL